ncbi:MAG: ubiquinone/menaquinone biosynthesis methyltransferase [Candidatus Dormibacteria bacterium]
MTHRGAEALVGTSHRPRQRRSLPLTGSTSLPPAEHKARSVEAMFDRIAGRYDLVNQVMTFGRDVAWRRRAVAEMRLASGSRVIDLACGTGDFCRELEREGHAVIGCDFSARMLQVAASRTRAPLVRADILRLPMPGGSADGATCGFALRNVVDIDACFAEMARVLRSGGRVAILEVAEPLRPRLQRLHALYFRHLVPLIGGVISDAAAYRYLPASTAYLPPPARLLQALRKAGFADARRVTMGLGGVQLLVGTRR